MPKEVWLWPKFMEFLVSSLTWLPFRRLTNPSHGFLVLLTAYTMEVMDAFKGTRGYMTLAKFDWLSHPNSHVEIHVPFTLHVSQPF